MYINMPRKYRNEHARAKHIHEVVVHPPRCPWCRRDGHLTYIAAGVYACTCDAEVADDGTLISHGLAHWHVEARRIG